MEQYVEYVSSGPALSGLTEIPTESFARVYLGTDYSRNSYIYRLYILIQLYRKVHIYVHTVTDYSRAQ